MCYGFFTVIALLAFFSVIVRFDSFNVLVRLDSFSVIARLDRAIHHFMSCFSDAPVEPEHDRNKGHYFLVCVIAQHFPLSVIARLDRAI